MTRLRHDLDHLTSLGLLVSAVATGVTGLIADLWDLNDFWYHTFAGYVMGALAIVHVALNWRALVSYARFRLARKPRPAPSATAPLQRRMPTPRPAPDPVGSFAFVRSLGRSLVSRRGLLGAAAGGIAGLVLGRGLRQEPTVPGGSDLGVLYHQWSKPGVIDVLGTVANWGQQPPLYKEYPDAPKIALPKPSLAGGMTTEEAIVRRRSNREYSPEPLALEDFSRVLYLASGICADEWGSKHRTAPSSGALYPLELYPVVHNVSGLERGVYHYAFTDHTLDFLRAEDLRARVVEQGVMQEYLGECAAIVFVTMIQQRMRFKYQDRSYRYGVIEAGHVGQNLYLAATSMGLGACAVGAFMDDDINAMLGVDGAEEAALYMLALGKRSATA